MPVEHIEFSTHAPGLELSAIPCWIIDGEDIRFVWANDPALELWRATDRAELFARDLVTGSPAKIEARTRAIVEQTRRGEVVREEWAFYPRGEPIMVMVELRGVVLPNGRFGVLNQAQPLGEEAPPSLRRAFAMSRNSATITALVGADGTILSRNPAALLAFGELESWPSWFCDADQAERILADALAGEGVRAEAHVKARDQSRWHLIEAHALRDPVTAELGVLVEHSDHTARLEAEHLAAARGQRIGRLEAALELVERQRREILALSAPILDVGDRTLAVPIIGGLDDQKSVEITEKLLSVVAGRGVRHVVLDVTGVAEVDGDGAGHLARMIRALRLLGAAPIISGIGPRLAHELMEVGFDTEGVPTVRSLAEALERRSKDG